MIYGAGQFKPRSEQKTLLIEKLEKLNVDKDIIAFIKSDNIESAIKRGTQLSDWHMQKLRRLL